MLILRAIGLVALGMSLTYNVHLYRTAFGPPATEDPEDLDVGEIPTIAVPSAVTPSADPVVTNEPVEADPPGCQQELATLREQERTEVERWRTALPVPRQFRANDVNPAAARGVDGLVAPFLQSFSHTLECRAELCKLTVISPEMTNADEWKNVLRTRPDLTIHAPIVAEELPVPSQDPVTQEGILAWPVYLRLSDPGRWSSDKAGPEGAK